MERETWIRLQTAEQIDPVSLFFFFVVNCQQTVCFLLRSEEINIQSDNIWTAFVVHSILLSPSTVLKNNKPFLYNKIKDETFSNFDVTVLLMVFNLLEFKNRANNQTYKHSLRTE